MTDQLVGTFGVLIGSDHVKTDVLPWFPSKINHEDALRLLRHGWKDKIEPCVIQSS